VQFSARSVPAVQCRTCYNPRVKPRWALGKFRAGVQYGDWKGTAAADNVDYGHGLQKYLEDKKLITDEEYLVAASMWVGENPGGGEIDQVYVHAYIYAGDDKLETVAAAIENQAEIPVREVDLALKIEDFIAMFKRFEVVLTWSSLDIGDREYRVVERTE